MSDYISFGFIMKALSSQVAWKTKRGPFQQLLLLCARRGIILYIQTVEYKRTQGSYVQQLICVQSSDCSSIMVKYQEPGVLLSIYEEWKGPIPSSCQYSDVCKLLLYMKIHRWLTGIILIMQIDRIYPECGWKKTTTAIIFSDEIIV